MDFNKVFGNLIKKIYNSAHLIPLYQHTCEIDRTFR